MRFLLYSRINAGNIYRSLGAPEYSYFFLLKEFRSVFEALGPTEVIADPAEADPIFDACAARGEDCVLIAFTAPHNAPAGLRCPMVPLFAWEFERIPDEAWDGNERNDWRRVLGECGRAITLSEHALTAVKSAMGDDFPVLALPLPLWDRMAVARHMCETDRADDDAQIMIDGAVLDTADYRISPDLIANRNPLAAFACSLWSGEDVALDFSLNSGDVGALGGFYLAEPWGSWSRNAEVWIALPRLLHGAVSIEFVVRAYGNNVGRRLLVGMNDEFLPLRAGAGLESAVLHFHLQRPTNMLHIVGIDVEPPAGGRDERTLGIGLERIVLRRSPPILQDRAECLAALARPLWDGGEMRLDFRQGSPDLGALDGFYPAENWGAWSQHAEARILLPQLLHGDVDIELVAMAYGNNPGKRLMVCAGDQLLPLQLGDELESRVLRFRLRDPASALLVVGLDPTPPAGASDARSLGIGIQGIVVRRAAGGKPESALRLDFRAGSEATALLQGFCVPESWGTWSLARAPWLLLPHPVSGRVRLGLCAVGYAENINRPLQIHLGAQTRELLLSGEPERRQLEFDLLEPAQVLGFTGISIAPAREPGDPRSLGIGLCSLELEAPDAAPAPAAGAHPAALHLRQLVRLDGVVYASVLNPRDDRKNWGLLVSAFCAAFADCGDATLVLKMTHHSQASYLFDLHYLLQRMPRFDCRIVVLHGYLQDDEYARFIRRSDFYVNVSKAEGLCIPLMEFMSCGKPALAPPHTSMADYLDASNCVLIDSSPEPCVWPHDERQVLRTLQYRIDWESAVAGFRRSRDLFRLDPEAYRRMGVAAMESMRGHCDTRRIEAAMGRFLAAAGAAADAAGRGGAP